MLRIAYRRTAGRGPEWARVEWLITETMRQRPIRKVWEVTLSKEQQFLTLLARAQKPLTILALSPFARVLMRSARAAVVALAFVS